MKKCIHCGAPLHEEASFCHHCAKSQRESHSPELPKRRKRGLRAAAALCLAAVLASGLWVLWPREEPPAEPAPGPGLSLAAEPASAPEPTPGPAVYDNGGAEIDYTADGESYRILASFTPREGEARFLSGNYSAGHAISPGGNYMTFTHLFVVSEAGEFANEAFGELVEEVRISAEPVGGSEALEPSAPTLSPDDPYVFRMSGFYYNESKGENELCWEIKMKNGDTLRLYQSFTVSTVEVLSLHYTEQPMATIEELRSLLESLSVGVDPDTEITLYLPPVVYEGGLSFETRSFELVGSTDGETGARTTFTGTVNVYGYGPTVSSFTNIAFAAEGQTGLYASESVWLENCAFTGCSVGAYADAGAWLCTLGCVFRDNGVGMEINNPGGARLTNTDFTGHSFMDNGVAFRLSACGSSETMDFIGCSFSGNGQDVECLTENKVNYVDCTWE